MTSAVLIILFVVAMAALGHELSLRLFAKRPDLSALERAVYGGVLAISAWLAIAWTLALAGRLTRTNLLVCGAIALLFAITAMLHRARGSFARPARPLAMTMLSLLPVVGYTIFLLWKGAVTPPSAPDGLTYHLPRAVMIVQTGTVERFEIPDIRVNRLPANYEVLLASMMLLEQGDELTEWLSTLFFVFFLAASAATARQWFGPGVQVLAVALIVATMPVLLLQGALHKNDAMVSGLLIAALLALTRWIDEGSIESALLLGLSTLCAVGTKSQALVVAALSFVAFAWALVNHLRAKRVALAKLVAVILILLALLPILGGYGYVIAQQSVAPSAQAIDRVAPVAYGEWSHLWIIPTLILAAPFLTNFESILVPWNGERWLWGSYDPFASHFGVLFTLLALAFPIGVWKFRRDAGDVSPRSRLTVTALALLSALAMLPVHAPIFGYVSGFPRYVMFAVPFIVVWTAVPFMTRVARLQRRAVGWLLLLLAAVVTEAAISVAVNDKFAPLWMVRRVAGMPGARWIPSMPRRAASVVDRLAAPNAVIDVYGALDTWSYPAFGANLARNVHFIHDASEIRPDAEWVIADRAYNVIWGDPNFRYMRDYPRYLGQGRPTADDLKLVRQLERDPRFELVFIDRPTAQVVFHRRGGVNDRDILRR